MSAETKQGGRRPEGREVTAEGVLRRRVLKFIRENKLLERPCLLVVGVSGGPDSVCLLHLLNSLRKELGLDLHVAHLNHQLRGAESEADADYVSHLADELGLPVTIGREDVRGHRESKGGNLEEVAREVRYRFLTTVAEQVKAEGVALGHTADDQVETVLLHLIRGTGLTGLRGMPPLSFYKLPSGRGLRLLRPLLCLTRGETQAYCETHRLLPRMDSSNLLLSHQRNRVRLELLPLLETYNPRIKETLLRTARLAGIDLAFMEFLVSQVWEDVVREDPGGIWLDNQAFSSLPQALKFHLLREVLRRLLGGLRDVELAHLEGLTQLMSSPAGKLLNLPHGLNFYGNYRESWLGREPPPCPFPSLEQEYVINVPGETRIPGWRVSARLVPSAGQEESRFCAHLDFGLIGERLVVRRRRPGDRFQPLGMEQPKKLQDFMVDAKIPRFWRDQVPLVCAGEDILWVVGWRIAQPYRVTSKTRQILRLEFRSTTTSSQRSQDA